MSICIGGNLVSGICIGGEMLNSICFGGELFEIDTSTDDAGTGGEPMDNNAPISNGSIPPAQTITLGDTITPMLFAACFTDADGDVLTYAEVDSLPPGLILNRATGVVSGTPTAENAGVLIRIEGTDPSGDSDECSTSLVVNPAAPVNQAPLANGTIPANQVIVIGASVAAFDFAACFSEPDGDALTYSVMGTLPAGLALSAAGQVTGTPTASTASAVTITVIATDAGGLSATCSATLTVNNAGSGLPIIECPPQQTFIQGIAITPFNATVAVGPVASWSASNLPAGLTINSATGVVSGTPTSSFNGAVTITAINANGSGFCSVPVSVDLPPATAPNISCRDISEALGDSVSMSPSNIGGGATGWSISPSLNPFGLEFDFNTGRVFGNSTDTGTQTFTITAMNTSGQDSCTFVLDIEE